MGKNRFEAFSDGVMAIILTIMVLELKVPRQPTLGALADLWPVYLAYTIAFGNVLANWMAHHHLFARIERIDARILMLNGLLLFFMSLVPFALSFGSDYHWSQPLPAAFYGAVMVLVCLAFAALRQAVLRAEPALAAATSVLGAAGIPHEDLRRIGDPGPTIAAAAVEKGCDLIMMGARGLGSHTAALLGSVAQSTIEHATMPVMVVK